jgi:hypothetical protein
VSTAPSPPRGDSHEERADGATGPRLSRRSRAALLAIDLLAAVAYSLTAPRWILGGDNGEFSTLYATGGIAHPPGYPTLVLWLRLWHWLPVVPAAYGAALATVVLGVAGVWMLQRACLAWGASAGATALASAAYAFSPVAWKMSCHAEVIAMNALFAAAILALSGPRARVEASRRAVALGLVAGTAVAAHQSIVLLAPIGLLAAARAVRDSRRPWRATLAASLALLVGVVVPYVYVYVVARTGDLRTTPMWIDAPTLDGLLALFRRASYGTLSLSNLPLRSHPLGNLWLFFRGAMRQTLGLPAVVLLAGAFALARGRHGTLDVRARRSLAALVASFVLAGPVFIACFNLPFEGAAPTVVERFYLLPEVVLTVLGALSLDVLVPWLLARDGWTAALTVQLSLTTGILTVPEVLEHNRPTVALYIENTLRAAPDHAIIVGTGDHRWGGFMYARYVLHLRPDVVCVVPAMMRQVWYRRDLEATLGVSFETPEHGAVGPEAFMARLLATGRPVLYTDWPAPAVEKTRHYSVGTLMRVLRDVEAPPLPPALESMNLEVFSRYALEPTPPRDPHGWGYGLQVDYARAWGELGEAYGRDGDVAKEQESYRRAARFAPWLVSRQ